MIENEVNQPIKYDPMEKRNEFIDHPSYVAPFAYETFRYMCIYFPRNVITTAKHVVVVEATKYLGKCMTICLIIACQKEAIYM